MPTPPEPQTALLTEVSAQLKNTRESLQSLEIDLERTGDFSDEKARAFYFRDTVLPDMKGLRTPVDKLEMLVDKEYWPMPSYGDMIFEV